MHWKYKVIMERILETRKCINCGGEFTVKTTVAKSSSKRQMFCQDCCSKLSLWERRVIRMKTFPEERQRYLEQKRQEFLRDYKRNMLVGAKRRASIKNIDFNITEEDIEIPSMCPILEVPLIIGTKDNYEYSPSLDRIDNSKGYVKGNIQVISKKANSMKNSATLEELQAFCRNVLRHSLTTMKEEHSELQDKEPVG